MRRHIHRHTNFLSPQLDSKGEVAFLGFIVFSALTWSRCPCVGCYANSLFDR